ncbi:EAL domain-containing protein [Pseudodesulfovibrio piezophilus]|uniref:EAL domain-containing protein n=1 Tax=Pseudodesulfovibrio piezophilus (strain DSM 21447 / JCM 15486 / C1TLV30) TaxID=1322246 RepID=M1WTR3_PSEP2|nr:EAL domain-containing protein [Pseudodesulfovibrio piezophilus]CCH49832.1 protein of unknown function [Pseudodesulfovibrio piezophilus C1TLV30]
MSDQPALQVDEHSVQEIVDSKNVHTFFQPVVSVVTKAIVGFEAFSRGGSDTLCVIDPKMLFHDQLSPRLKVNVDRLCREKALMQFKPIHSNHKNLLVYVNINPDILAHVGEGSKVLMHQVASLDITLENIVLECPACKAHSPGLQEYADMYRDFGFKLCLDNCHIDDTFGSVMANLKPDFIKVGQSFYAENQRQDHSSRALDGVLSAAEGIGAAVIAQGVESEEDSLRLLAAGVHLQQGYYYTKDESDTTGDPAQMFFKKILDTHDKFKKVKRRILKQKKARYKAAFKVVSSICSKLSNTSEAGFEGMCRKMLHASDDVISLFILNDDGDQITSRHHVESRATGICSASILGSHKGADHSIQDYVLYLDMGYDKFVTQPFRSPYTGENACIISKPVFNKEGDRYLICIEMPHPG